MRSSQRQRRLGAGAATLVLLQFLFTHPALAEEAAGQAQAEPRKWLALGLGIGFALGGDDLLHVEFDSGDDTTLSAGNGFVVDLGAMAMPVWIGPVGLGASVKLGIKYAGIEASNGSASFTRFPLVVAARGTFHVASGWSILAAGGIHYDLSASLSGDGVLGEIDLDSDSALGPMIELGAYYDEGSMALDLTLRYTGLQYELGGSEVDATSVGAFAAFYFFVL